MNEPLRPVEIKKYENEHEASIDGLTTRVTKGFFHRWADKYARVGEHEKCGPFAIVEAKNGQVVLVELGPTVSIRFTDVGPSENLEDVRCETCIGKVTNQHPCEDCGGTGWVKRVVPTNERNVK